MAKFKGSKADKQIPQWLETIQENSWEAELLLSAVLLFGLIQTPIYLDGWSNQVFAWEESEFVGLFRHLIRGLEILRVGFIIHIIVRAMWIAQVGFSYVYPRGIKLNNLNFKGRFKSELVNNSSIIDSILSLEKIASMIFAISFSLFGLLVGFATWAMPFVLMVLGIKNEVLGDATLGVFITLIIIYALFSFLVFIDFITNGWLRRGERRAKIFYPISWIFRILTLSFIYRRTILTILSNTSGYKKYIFTAALVSVIIFNKDTSNWFTDYKTNIYAKNTQEGYLQNSNYESKRHEEDILVASIPNDIINQNTLPVFLKDQKYFELPDLEIKQDSTQDGELKVKTNMDSKSAEENIKDLQEILVVLMDEDTIKDLSWIKTVHPVTHESGFKAYLNVESLSEGSHHLKFRVQFKKRMNFLKDTLIANIPFYKAPNTK